MKLFLTIVIFGMIAILLSILYEYDRIISRDFKPDEEEKGNKNSDKKALILWVPSKHKGCENLKNEIANNLKEKGFFVKINHPNIENIYDYREFNFICFITPVYFGNVSKSMCELIVKSNFTNKKVAIICVGRALNTKKETDYMRSLLDKENDISTIKVTSEEIKRTNDFINSAII